MNNKTYDIKLGVGPASSICQDLDEFCGGWSALVAYSQLLGWNSRSHILRVKLVMTVGKCYLLRSQKRFDYC